MANIICIIFRAVCFSFLSSLSNSCSTWQKSHSTPSEAVMNCMAGINWSAGMLFKTWMFLYCWAAVLTAEPEPACGDCAACPLRMFPACPRTTIAPQSAATRIQKALRADSKVLSPSVKRAGSLTNRGARDPACCGAAHFPSRMLRGKCRQMARPLLTSKHCSGVVESGCRQNPTRPTRISADQSGDPSAALARGIDVLTLLQLWEWESARDQSPSVVQQLIQGAVQ